MTPTNTPDSTIELLARLTIEPPRDLYRATVLGADAGDRVARTDSPIGPVWIAWSNRGITAVGPLFADASPQAFASQHRREVFQDDALPAELATVVSDGLDTGDTSDVPVDFRGMGAFQRSVLAACSSIPVGAVRPYGWIAEEIGNPGAVRAVGTALGKNPIPLIVPCHRVVRSDGSVGNYAFGPDRKRDLLIREGALLA